MITNHHQDAHKKETFIIESESALGARNWKSAVQAWIARDAHCGHFRVCHLDGDADDGGGERKTSILQENGPCKKMSTEENTVAELEKLGNKTGGKLPYL
jgi:hypothetical protein